MSIVFLGLSIDWSWGNSHATNYRAPVLALRQRGHDTLFLERDAPWFAVQRDAPSAAVLYASVDELHVRHDAAVRNADLVVLGSSVPDGVAVGEWLLETARGATAFYDFDKASIPFVDAQGYRPIQARAISASATSARTATTRRTRSSGCSSTRRTGRRLAASPSPDRSTRSRSRGRDIPRRAHRRRRARPNARADAPRAAARRRL
jgi:hypothetical protein